MTLTDDQYYISRWTAFSLAMLSFIFSLLTLYVIFCMCDASITTSNNEQPKNPIHQECGQDSNLSESQDVIRLSMRSTTASVSASAGRKFNGYLLLITSMALCQIMYDLSYILPVIHDYTTCVTYHFLACFGGLSVVLWTNILSFIIYYVVTYIRSVVRN